MTETKTAEKATQTFEGEILVPVIKAAQARAASQAQRLSDVGRAVLVAASKAAKPSEDGVAHPAVRPTTAARKRMRLQFEKHEYDVIKERIRASGTSVTAALEKGLEAYARTGEL